jgi:asparagine synthase (glutamine-hydrolysing)
LLRYEDKNSMAFSLETRTPFIDYRLVDFVFSLPACYKIHDGWTKYLLRNSTGGLLPEKVRWRKDKMGFPTPEKIWFKENRKLIHDIFSYSHKSLSDNYLDRKNILNNLDTFLNDKNVTGISTLWRPINLELWLKKMFP